MIRLRSPADGTPGPAGPPGEPGGIGVPGPGAVLTTPLGSVMSDPIVSVNACVVHSVTQTPSASTMTVETVTPHGYVSGAEVTVRINGWHGVTHQRHPAGRIAPWTLTVVDPRRFILDGSLWVEDSVALHGWCWSGDLIDACPILKELGDVAAMEGPSTLLLPAGSIVFTTSDLGSGFRMKPGLTLAGAGRSSTYLILGDGVDARIITGDVDAQSTEIRDLTCIGRRCYGLSGYHNIRYGDDSDPAGTIINARISHVASLASAGYGMGFQGNGSFQRFVFEDVHVIGCANDGIDFKNRSNGTIDNRITGAFVSHIALGDKGHDMLPIAAGADPFTTTSGSSIVVVAQEAHPYIAGITITYSGAATFNGVNMNGSFTVVLRTADTYSVESNQVASGTGSGGGSSVSAYPAMTRVGKAGIDLRGRRWNVSNVNLSGDFTGRVGIRGRGPVVRNVDPANGVGADAAVLSNIAGRNNFSPALEINGSAGSTMVQWHSDRVVLSGATSHAFATAVSCGSGSRFGMAEGIVATESVNAFVNIGEHNTFANCTSIGASAVSFTASGDSIPVGEDLPDDPVYTTNLSTVVKMTLPMHGMLVGDEVSFAGIAEINGVWVRGTYPVDAIVDDDNIEITSITAATATGSGGGDAGYYLFGETDHRSLSATFIACTSYSSELGFLATGLADNAVFEACRSVNDAGVFGDGGTNTLWHGIGTLPHKEHLVAVPLDGTLAILATSDANSVYWLSGSASSKGMIKLPVVGDSHSGVRITFKNSAAVGLRISAAGVDDRIRVGTVITAGGGWIETAELGAAVTLEVNNQDSWSASSVIGVWTSGTGP